MFQSIAVALIGLAALVYVGVKIYRLFVSHKGESPCGGCSHCPGGKSCCH